MRLLRLFICTLVMIGALILFAVAIHDAMYGKGAVCAVIATVSGILALRSFVG
jgi:hypothetical protein